MSDEYDVEIERTGRIWHRVVLTWNPAATWIVMEHRRWSVPGRRWAYRKARRVMRDIVRQERYRAEFNPPHGQKVSRTVTVPPRRDSPPPPPMSQ